MAHQWQLQDAKARFSQLVKQALAGDAQVITRRGNKAVVVIPYEEYERLQANTKSAWEIFQGAPRLDSDELPIARDGSFVRPIDLP